MIRLPDLNLPHRAQADLIRWQRAVDSNATYAARVAAAKRLFALKNTNSNPSFRVVRSTLKQMCQGAQRCGYCEDSVADEVEHIKPKDWFPEEVFQWRNYLYACGPCNSPKNNKFAIFEAGARGLIHLVRDTSNPLDPPPNGDPVLINPRLEDPLEFLELDLVDTFYFSPRFRIVGEPRERAIYTIEILRLNERDYLVQARETAFDSFRARLLEYDERKRAGAGDPELVRRVESLRRMHHQTVWREMVRQRAMMAALRPLFDANPEALTW
jgi:uncharacterized protein (TIGR02646 family)